MKKYLLTGGLATILVLTACGNEEQTEHSNDTSVNNSLEEEDVDSEASSEERPESMDAEATEEEETDDNSASKKGTRSNPYQIGETAEITIREYDDDFNELEGVANISFDNILRGQEALDEINTGPGYIEEPDDGMEWMTFDFTFELIDYVDDDTRYTFATNFPVYNDNGESVVGTTTAVGETTGNSLYTGGEITGRHAQTIPADETILISFSDAEEDILFKVPSEEDATTSSEESNKDITSGETTSIEEASDDDVSTEASFEDEETVEGITVAEEPEAESFNITDQATLESIIYGDYSEVEKIQAYNNAVSNGVIPQGTVTSGSAISAYESSLGLQSGESEYDQMKETYQSWVDEGLMTETEMEEELNKLE